MPKSEAIILLVYLGGRQSPAGCPESSRRHTRLVGDGLLSLPVSCVKMLYVVANVDEVGVKISVNNGGDASIFFG